MKRYDIEVVVVYKYQVEAEDPYNAYLEAQDYNEYWADSQVERVTISHGIETITHN